MATPPELSLPEAPGVSPEEAVAGAHALYTDVWVSMGDDEADAERRRALLAPYRIDEELLAQARDDAIVLHCLPAHPGEEITEDVLYGERSAVWDQAENRLHAQKALLELLTRFPTSSAAMTKLLALLARLPRPRPLAACGGDDDSTAAAAAAREQPAEQRRRAAGGGGGGTSVSHARTSSSTRRT